MSKTADTSSEHNAECVKQYKETGVLQSVRKLFSAGMPGPDPELVRGRCPECGDNLVSNCYYVGGRGYVIAWECWSSLNAQPTCNYRKVI